MNLNAPEHSWIIVPKDCRLTFNIKLPYENKTMWGTKSFNYKQHRYSYFIFSSFMAVNFDRNIPHTYHTCKRSTHVCVTITSMAGLQILVTTTLMWLRAYAHEYCKLCHYVHNACRSYSSRSTAHRKCRDA